jgi:3-oxoadipate enol-lactonase
MTNDIDTSTNARRTDVIAVGSSRVAYEVGGAGDAVVLVHAGVADRTMWDPQVGVLADRCRWLRFDNPNFGDSTLGPGRLAPLDVLTAVMDAAQMDRAVLVGASMGGGMAIDAAIARPDRVRALVLVGAGVSGRPPSSESMAEVGAMEALRAAGDVEGYADRSMRWWIAGPGRSPDLLAPDFRERAHRWQRENGARRWPADLDLALVEPPAAGRLAEIRVPALVIVGDSDVPDVLDTARDLAAGIAGARLEVVRDAAHLPSVERPDVFNRLLLDFLSALRTGGL